MQRNLISRDFKSVLSKNEQKDISKEERLQMKRKKNVENMIKIPRYSIVTIRILCMFTLVQSVLDTH